jgi:YHS domain-containing protein/thiol-disulfide isomerase/thioredoxin
MRAFRNTRIGIDPSDWVTRAFWMVAGLIVLAFFAPRIVVGDETPATWRTDFKAALKEAEERKLPLLIHFYADWCMPCKRMEREVLGTPPVKELIGRRFVAVKLNADDSQHIIQRYGVNTLPSDVVVDSLNGKVISINSGFQDSIRYVTSASQAEARFLKFHAADSKDAAESSDAATKDGAPQAGSKAADVEKPVELGDPQPVVGLDGYSPVALTKSRKWTRGSANFAWDYKDVTYYLSSREELIEFRNSPESFAPKLLGCDPVILWETDRAVAGSVEYGAFFDGELYLFKTEERRKQFKANPQKFNRLQHALKADQIEPTVMR